MNRSRRLLALTAVVAATVALLGPPASAAPDGTVEVHAFLRSLTLPADGPPVDEHLAVLLTSDRAGWAGEVTVNVDTSAIGAVGDVDVEASFDGADCSAAGAVTRCMLPGPHRVYDLPENGSIGIVTSSFVTIRVTPKPGATVGTTGALTVTARADDGPTTTRTSTVRIGEGVNLTAVDLGAVTVAPGGTAALRPQVRNTGARAVEGVTLVVSAGEETLADTDYGNCTYGYVVACTFDTTLATGQTYRLSAPFTVGVPKDAAVGSETGMVLQWLTLAEWEDWQDTMDSLSSGRQGTGPDLELNQFATAAAVPQADVDDDDNGTYAQVTVTGGQRPDVVAVGATVAAQVGETHTIDVGVVNRGPGTLHFPPFFNNLPEVDVSLPPGLSVVRADERCSLLGDVEDDPAGPPPSPDPEEPWHSGPPLYSCRTESVHLKPGQQLSYAFTVRVDPGARDGEGSVEVVLYDGKDDFDRDAGNNTAPITLSLGGAGGGLPVTGTATTLVAGGGLLLVLFGAAVTLVLRRRTRFTV